MRVEPPASAPSLASAAAAAVGAAVAVAASSRLAILQLTNLQKVGNNNNVDVAGNAIDGNWLTFVLFKFVFFGLPLSLSAAAAARPRVCVLCVCELTLRRILSHSSQLGYTPQKEMRIVT